MKVDADSLEQLNLRTRDGAERAGRTLSELADAETQVGTTRITLVSQQDLAGEVSALDGECVEFDLSGPLSGRVLLAFDDGIRKRLETAGDREEAAVDIVDAFVAEWADHAGGELSVGAPRYVRDPTEHDFGLEAVTADTESTPVFRSSVRETDGGGVVTLYFAPDAESLETLLSVETDSADDAFGLDSGDTDTPDFGGEDAFGDETGTDEDAPADAFDGDGTAEDAFGGGETADDASGDDETADDPFGDDAAGEAFGSDGADDGSLFEDDETTSLPLEKLSVFSDLTREGTSAAADRVTAMTGIETATEISGVTFTPIDDISAQLADGEYVGTTAEFGGTPSGAVVVLYRASTAEQIAEAMLPMEPEDDGITDMHESALAELGNIIISGFIDGWANVLQNTVDHTPPEFESDMEMRMLELVTDQLGPFQTHAYTVESRIEADDLEFDCEIHALPDEAKLGEALDSLLIERREKVQADPDDIF